MSPISSNAPKRRLLATVLGAALALSGLVAAPATATEFAFPLVPAALAISPSDVVVTGGSATDRDKVRTYLKKYAKNTSILSVKIGSYDHWGTTTFYLNGDNTLSGQCSIEISKKSNHNAFASTARLKYVMAHEVFHCQQAFAYQSDTTWTQLQKIMNKKFGGSGTRGIDNAADCGAIVQDAAYSGAPYKKKCTAAQKKAAKKVINGQQF
ncbi:MAG: hypothetical protein LBR27_03335 [Bifidobacteriaceae bacterium]|jgi:hypothetical protein|nr:hypothetical protein [Bifidobacteriaceae bacterium]